MAFEEIKKYTLGNGIKKVRIEKHITQQELAERLGISQSAVSAMERSGDSIQMETLKRVAAALEVDFRRFFPPVFDTTTNTTYNVDGTQLSEDLSKLESIENDFSILNSDGRKEAAKRVHELTLIPEYTEKEE